MVGSVMQWTKESTKQKVATNILFASDGLHAPEAKTPWTVAQNMSFVQIHLRSNLQPAAAMT